MSINKREKLRIQHVLARIEGLGLNLRLRKGDKSRTEEIPEESFTIKP